MGGHTLPSYTLSRYESISKAIVIGFLIESAACYNAVRSYSGEVGCGFLSGCITPQSYLSSHCVPK